MRVIPSAGNFTDTVDRCPIKINIVAEIDDTGQRVALYVQVIFHRGEFRRRIDIGDNRDQNIIPRTGSVDRDEFFARFNGCEFAFLDDHTVRAGRIVKARIAVFNIGDPCKALKFNRDRAIGEEICDDGIRQIRLNGIFDRDHGFNTVRINGRGHNDRNFRSVYNRTCYRKFAVRRKANAVDRSFQSKRDGGELRRAGNRQLRICNADRYRGLRDSEIRLRTEHIRTRLEHGNFAHFRPDVAVKADKLVVFIGKPVGEVRISADKRLDVLARHRGSRIILRDQIAFRQSALRFFICIGLMVCTAVCIIVCYRRQLVAPVSIPSRSGRAPAVDCIQIVKVIFTSAIRAGNHTRNDNTALSVIAIRPIVYHCKNVVYSSRRRIER